MQYIGKLKNYLSNNIWYHATTLDGWKNICKIGIKADYNKDTSSSLDFGYGFYLTDKQKKAEDFIIRLKSAGVLLESDILVIIAFEFDVLSWFEGEEYNTHVLNEYNDEFASFVFENRIQNENGENQHKYDAIFGVMSDSQPIQIVMDYRLGILTKNDALECLKKATSMKQISLHNQKLCDIIKPQRVYTFDMITKSREELNVNDYSNK